jgi:microcystin-dependent protein
VAETLTANYGWTKPDPGASANTWGATLNATTDKIDNQVHTNQQAAAANAAPIGSITMWSGVSTTPPTGWLLCDGSAVSQTTYAALYAIVGTTFNVAGVAAGNFNLPNLVSRFPLGAASGTRGQTGGEATHLLTTAELAAHAHPITDVAHSHTAQQNAHSHAIATGSHSHAITTGSHAHGSSLMRFVGSGGAQGVGVAPNNVVEGNTDTVGNLGGNTDTAGNLGGNTDAQTPGVGVNASGTGLSTTQNAGGGAAHNNMPPYLQIPFIIRYQ